MRLVLSFLLLVGGAGATDVSVYGAWHCGNDYCNWAAARDLTEFDSKNHWLIDRGDGKPSVNLVVLSFVDPLRLLNNTTDGIPAGMTQDVVSYFTSRGIRVMLAIGVKVAPKITSPRSCALPMSC